MKSKTGLGGPLSPSSGCGRNTVAMATQIYQAKTFNLLSEALSDQLESEPISTNFFQPIIFN